jgi:hypothetical protein
MAANIRPCIMRDEERALGRKRRTRRKIQKRASQRAFVWMLSRSKIFKGIKKSLPFHRAFSKSELTMIKFKSSALAFILTTVFVCAPQLMQAQYTNRNMHFGVSGGNVNDITRAFCCSGTLGSLVSAGGTQYILSNNHVLARQDQAAPGEDISQPGLIDNGCQPATIVADYSAAVMLGNNVDCAVAALRSGQMDSTGYIEGIGTISSIVKPPAVGLGVQKSGRTTGHTTGTISSINTSVSVQYQLQCGKGRKYTLSYTNQVVINSTTFSAGGDSGSLIVTNNTCRQPVALLFAGSSTDTIGNPIGEVLTKLGTQPGLSGISFVGSTCSQQPGAPELQFPQQALDHASRILEQNRHDLMSRPGVLGVGFGVLEDNSAPAIVVYVDKTSSSTPQLPAQIDNVPVRVVMTDPFIAF